MCKISLTLLQAVKSCPFFGNNCANRTLSSMWLTYSIHCNTNVMSRCLACVQWTGLVLQAAKRVQVNMYLTQLPDMKWVPADYVPVTGSKQHWPSEPLCWLSVVLIVNPHIYVPVPGSVCPVVPQSQGVPVPLCPSPRECLSRCVPIPYIEYLSRCVLVPYTECLSRCVPVPYIEYLSRCVPVPYIEYLSRCVPVPYIEYLSYHVLVPYTEYLSRCVLVPYIEYLSRCVPVPYIEYLSCHVLVPYTEYLPRCVLVPYIEYLSRCVLVAYIEYLSCCVLVPLSTCPVMS